MIKKRIIFKLLFDNGIFCLSRNFKLQKIGDVNWLFDRLKFGDISNYIDELVILNVSRDNFKDPLNKKFSKSIEKLMKKTFIPLTIGGGLRTIKQVNECFRIGADKIILNSSVKENKDLTKLCVKKFGSQAVILGIDFREHNKKFYSYIKNGTQKYLELNKHFKLAKKMNFGEVFINSIDRDGTGFGLEKRILNLYNLRLPLVLSGGAGKPEHFAEFIKERKINGLMTGNLYNFLGNGLKNLRDKLIKSGISLRIT